MGLFKSIKQGLARAMTPPTPEQMAEMLEQLPPDNRAELEANMALANRGTADAQALFEQERDRRIASRVLDGPAGEYLYGRAEDLEGPEDVGRRMQEEGAGSVYKGMLGDAAAGLKAGAREFTTGGKMLTDPEARARVSAEHRAARDAARAPYLAAAVPPITISRLATRGGTQIEEVAAYLEHSGLADRPERVYGVYRVPDRISPTLSTTSERGRVVESDVVHEPGPTPARRRPRSTTPGSPPTNSGSPAASGSRRSSTRTSAWTTASAPVYRPSAAWASPATASSSTPTTARRAHWSAPS